LSISRLPLASIGRRDLLQEGGFDPLDRHFTKIGEEIGRKGPLDLLKVAGRLLVALLRGQQLFCNGLERCCLRRISANGGNLALGDGI
jgi:hypothetical protein